MKHVLSEQQADKLGYPALTGVEVDVVLCEDSENYSPNFPDVPVAKEVYLQGTFLGGYLALADVSWDELVRQELDRLNKEGEK